MVPEGGTSSAEHMGEHETHGGGYIQFSPQPNTIPETHVAPESGQHPLKEGSVPVPPVASIHPDAPDNLLEALRGLSIVEEHRTLMGVVIERIKSAKSGLTEACISLLTSFEVSHMTLKRMSQCSL